MPTSPQAPEPKPVQEQLSLLPPGEDESSPQAARATVAAAVAKTIRRRRYKQGPNPLQPMLLPPSVEDYVATDSPVRAIKAYVDTVDFEAFGFKNTTASSNAGQPAFAPADLLELYLYGYLNRVRSSRRLEAECRRNLEVIWLLNGLHPSYHTIADFRKDNPEALKKTNSDFIQLCREFGLFGGKVIGIDGSFFNGNASHASVKTKKQLESELAAIEKEVEGYQQQLDNNDAAETDLPEDATTSAAQLDALKARAQLNTEAPEQQDDQDETSGLPAEANAPQDVGNNDVNETVLATDADEQSAPADASPSQTTEPGEPPSSASETPTTCTGVDRQPSCDSNDTAELTPAEAAAMTEKLATLKIQAQEKSDQIDKLKKTGETQLSRTDPDARRLTKHGKKVTGYNVQTVIDAEFKLILTHEVTNAGNDFGQLVPMIEKAKDVLADGIAQALSPQQTAVQEDPLVALADAGYFTETDIATCDANNTTLYVPIPNKYRAMLAQGRLPGSAFHYDASQDHYICPGQQTLSPIGKPSTHRGVLRQRYQSQAEQCKSCSHRSQCLPKKMPIRQIYRSQYADVVERHRQHMADSADKMRQRAALCEHPFGTMKRWLGWDHFLVRGFKKVRGEMALLVHCYNFKRVLNILGLDAFIAACEARRLRRQAEGENEGLLHLFHTLFRRSQRLLRPFFRADGLFPSQIFVRPETRPALAAAR